MAWPEDLRELGPLEAAPLAVVTTDSSVWLIDATTYTRLPLTECPDPGRHAGSHWDRLRDGQRHPHRGATWVVDDRSAETRVRVRPEAGPPDGYGILTGVVVTATGLAAGDPMAE